MVIATLSLDAIEKILNDLSKESLRIKLLQEEIANLDRNLQENKAFFSSGRTSKEIYEYIKDMLESERKALLDKLEKPMATTLGLSEELDKIMNANRV